MEHGQAHPRWEERQVDRALEHFELRYGSVEDGGWDEWLPAALVGPPVNGVFAVQLLVDRARSDQHSIVAKVIKEIEFYIIELGEPDPWRYLQYHCGTSANAYSDVHWSFSAGESPPDSR
jgi:hypothetical protein